MIRDGVLDTIAKSLPAGWRLLPLKRVAAIRYGLGQPPPALDNGVPLLRATNVTRGVITDAGLILVDPEGVPPGRNARLRAGEIIVVRSGAYTGDSAIVPDRFDNALTGYDMVVRARSVDSRFLAWQFLANHVLDYQFSLVKSRAAQPHLNAEDLGETQIAVSSLRTQKRVADFLDRETAKIDVLIAKQTEFLTRLDEHRRALINEAVTRGLDPSAPMRESGRPNLGIVAASWTVRRLKEVLSKVQQGWSPQCENRTAEPGEWGVLKVGCVNGSHFDDNENKALPPNLEPIPALEVRSGDILMSRANTVELVGSICLVGEIQPRLLLCDKLYRLRFDPAKVDTRFVVYCLSSPVGRQPLEAGATGASPSMKNISQDAVKDVWLAFPPLVEQREIADFLDRRRDAISRIRGAVLKMLDRLRERRTALITAAVTGQIDVTHPALSEAAA